MKSVCIPEQLTAGPGNDQLLYFTTTSLDPGDCRLWFIRECEGQPNLWLRDLSSCVERQLTDNQNGRMWQYQGFAGTRGRGLAVWSVALDAPRGLLYHIQDNELRCVDAHGTGRTLASLPADQTTGFIAVSDCGQWVCVPTTDDRALGEPTLVNCAPGGAAAIDQRCQDEGLNSYLRVYETGTGRLASCVAVPRCWITHVQFRPGRPTEILYNHEWPDRGGMRRMWLWDGQRHHCLRPASTAHRPEDWVCHEVWSMDGQQVIYHGSRAKGAAFIGRRDMLTGQLQEIDLPDGWKRYGHFQIATHQPNVLVCDGYYETTDDVSGGPSEWISLVEVDWEQGRLNWRSLCRHRSAWRSQDDHPHPIFDHAGRHVYFTGGTDNGGRAVYRVDATDQLATLKGAPR